MEVIYPQISNEITKDSKLNELKQWHDTQIEAIKSKYSKAEIDSFLDKRNEAMAWREDNTAKTPYIDAMAGGDTDIRAMLITSILAKVDATAQLEMFVLTTRDRIATCTTQEELEAVIW